jgi:opacity protein-like surface antigen
MHASSCVIAAALLAVGLSGTATAQSTNTPNTGQPTTTADYFGATQSHWIASGFVGTNFGDSTFDPSVTFGGQIGYLWHGIVGTELLGDFAPTFKLSNALLADDPHVYSYMANAIAAVPFGSQGQFQPYISGGVGGIQMRTSIVSLTDPSGTTSGNQTRFGSNIGGGFMGFTGNVGIRGDVRYYKATVDDSFSATTANELFTQGLLSGLDFWRANIGVAFRW